MNSSALLQLTPLSHSKEERADLLEKSGWWKRFEWKDVVDFAHYLQIFEVKPQQDIVREGAQEGFMSFIVSGSVEVIKDDANDQRKVVARLGKGRAFGEMSLIDGGPRSAAVRASEKTIILVLTLSNFEQLKVQRPTLAIRFLTYLCTMMSERLRSTTGRLLSFLDAEE